LGLSFESVELSAETYPRQVVSQAQQNIQKVQLHFARSFNLPTWGTWSVTDKRTRVCMDPGGNGATMNAGGERGPGPPGKGEDKQLVPNSGDG
jgi:hypothetical protein